MVFGVTSEKIKIASVSRMVAIDTPSSGLSTQILWAIKVAIEAAAILTKLLPIKITPIRRSVLASSFEARLAPL